MPPQSPDDLVIELMTRQYVHKGFTCGDAKLDDYLKRNAIKNTEYGFGRAFVAVMKGEKRIWGFYTLSAAHLDAALLSSATGAPKFVSVALMGRLAVDSQAQRRGIGDMLMAHMFENAVKASEHVGIHAILVHPKDQRAKDYYLSYGFDSMVDEPLHVALPIGRIPRKDAST